MTDRVQRIVDNLTRIKERIAGAAERSGRTEQDITLVAVTKYVDADVVRELVDAGCTNVGESRPQELWRKAEALNNVSIRWHMIGHLQRNKILRTIPLISLLHSGDSERLLSAVDSFGGEHDIVMPVLLEVNVSGDESKHGLIPEALEDTVSKLASLKNIRIRGLMAMAARDGGVDRAKEDFAKLRKLRDNLRRNCPPSLSLDEMSMGMSRDFEAAIEEGATLVRVGSALFEGISND